MNIVSTTSIATYVIAMPCSYLQTNYYVHANIIAVHALYAANMCHAIHML